EARQFRPGFDDLRSTANLTARHALLELVARDAPAPDGPERLSQAARDDDAPPFVVVQMPAVVDRRDSLLRSTEAGQLAPVERDEEHKALGEPPGSPVLPAQVTAQDARQPTCRAVELERRRLAVVLGDDRPVFPVRVREATPCGCGLVGELEP